MSEGGKNVKSLVDLLSETEHLTDFTVKCGSLEIPTHKILLAKASPVFHAMFAHKDFSENITNSVEIENTTEEAVKIVMDFIYEREIPELSEALTKEVYILSDRYDLPKLRESCAISLVFFTTMENALDMFKFVSVFEGEPVWETVIYEISCLYQSLSETEEYRDFVLNNPELAMKLMAAIVTELQSMGHNFINRIRRDHFNWKSYVIENHRHLLFQGLDLSSILNEVSSNESEEEVSSSDSEEEVFTSESEEDVYSLKSEDEVSSSESEEDFSSTESEDVVSTSESEEEVSSSESEDE